MTPIRQIFALGVLGLAIAVGSGCASQSSPEKYDRERPAGIPSDAVIQSTGTATLKFTPIADGRVYIHDRTADKLLYEGAVRRGEVVEVDSPHNRILVAGRPVSERDLKPGHDKELYFKPEPVASAVVEERTVRYNDTARTPIPAGVPNDATMTMTGNAQLRYDAPSDGRVFIYDHTANKVLYDGVVRRGELVEVDSPHNRILVGGRIVSERDLKPGHDKEIYFRPEPTPTGTVEERTVIREKVIEK
jgi:hypothetical protein